MPFVKKTDTQGTHLSSRAGKLFIGRTGELLFFVQNILKPEDPTHNIISISGQGGVGKSTLLNRFIDEARSSSFKHYCLTAFVDERRTTPVDMMEKFAEQLHLSGEFEKALKRYKERLCKQEAERETLQETLWRKAPDFAGAAVEGIPFAGPILREATKTTTAHLLKERQVTWLHKDTEQLEYPLDELTNAFVTELNHLAETKVTRSSQKPRQLRVLLFFDTFEQLASEAVPWLLDYFLEAEINNNVVLVIAGRDSIEHSAPHNTKLWLPYFDSETIYSISLNSFTKDETRIYLAQRGITNSEQIDRIWQLSRGLPLYLALLTSNPRGKVDPTKDVVDNFLWWIPEHEHIKRQLALDAALFSRPFNQDDLKAFTYLSDHDRSTLYRWLIGQPFVLPQDGRYSYHDLAKELFSRHFYEHSREDYYATRTVLAHNYQRLLEEIQIKEGKEVYHSTEWFHLSLALVSQLFLLPNEAGHIKAIEQILSVDVHTYYVRRREIAGMLRELSGASINGISLHTQQIIKYLSQFIGHPQEGRKRLETDMFLLHTVASESSFSSKLLAYIYEDRGWAYRDLNDHQRASDDFQRALALFDPLDHRGRGWAYLPLGEYRQAISEFDLALELNPHDDEAYHGRGWMSFYLKEYQQAIDDFERTLKLNPNQTGAHNGLGQIHKIFKEYPQALAHYERMVEVDPTHGLGYALQGEVYIHLKEYQQAIANFERALELSPWNTYQWYMKGYVYLWLKDMEQAWADFTRSCDPHLLIMGGWMAEWVKMCQRGASSNTLERLEELIASVASPTGYYPCVCQGVAHLLRGRYEEALAELEQAIPLPYDEPWDGYFWKGMACVFLERDEEAMEAIAKSLEEGMPPVLLAPLHWFKQERHDFYVKYVVPLLAKHD